MNEQQMELLSRLAGERLEWIVNLETTESNLLRRLINVSKLLFEEYSRMCQGAPTKLSHQRIESSIELVAKLANEYAEKFRKSIAANAFYTASAKHHACLEKAIELLDGYWYESRRAITNSSLNAVPIPIRMDVNTGLIAPPPPYYRHPGPYNEIVKAPFGEVNKLLVQNLGTSP